MRRTPLVNSEFIGTAPIGGWAMSCAGHRSALFGPADSTTRSHPNAITFRARTGLFEGYPWARRRNCAFRLLPGTTDLRQTAPPRRRCR